MLSGRREPRVQSVVFALHLELFLAGLRGRRQAALHVLGHHYLAWSGTPLESSSDVDHIAQGREVLHPFRPDVADPRSPTVQAHPNRQFSDRLLGLDRPRHRPGQLAGNPC